MVLLMTPSRTLKSQDEATPKQDFLCADFGQGTDSCSACIDTGSSAVLPTKAELSQYSPPEVILAATSPAARTVTPVDTAADMWAVGAMLLELLTARSSHPGGHANVTPVDTDATATLVDTVAVQSTLEKLRRTASGKVAYRWEPAARGNVGLLGRLRGVRGVVCTLPHSILPCGCSIPVPSLSWKLLLLSYS